MGFIVDRESRRTYDPDRGYELRSTGSGSDGNHSFVINMPTRAFHFSAAIDCALQAEEIERLGPGFSKQLGIWLVYSSISSPEDRAIVREALLAYKMGGGGDFPNTQWFVRFGKDSIFDA